MRCITHINKICLHTNGALRQVKLVYWHYPQIVNTVHLRWSPCVFCKFSSVSCHQCGSKVIDKLFTQGEGLPSVDAPSVRSRSVRLGKNSLDPDSDIQLKATWLLMQPMYTDA
ncbi:conserved hypothetical protein [Trichinella spiralis]|uniref:hypothetical protein n=1 Tax=Trichinella spiralis TaxID=6334 RepID=UPI0001EFB406|nr:conserved hypothetical protein [Trichinella spiralis]